MSSETSSIPYKKHVGAAIRALREARGLVQEDFADMTSRTFFSDVERGVKSPTIDKVQQYAERMLVTPATIFALADALRAESGTEEVLVRVRGEIDASR